MKKLLLAVAFCLLGLTGCRRDSCDPCQPCDPCPAQTYCPECKEYHEPEPMPMRRGMQTRQPMRQQVYTDEMMDTTMAQGAPQARTNGKVITEQRTTEAKAKAQVQAQAKEQTTPQITKTAQPAPKMLNGTTKK